MSLPISRLKIGSTELPIETHYRDCKVSVEPHASGRRKLSVAAAGRVLPDLSGVSWSGAVTVYWRDLGDEAGGWKSLAIISLGPQEGEDYGWPPGVTWSLSGWEAPAGSVLVSVDGTEYWARMAVGPGGGTFQRMTDGSFWLLQAGGARSVRISGESAAAPAVEAGSVEVSGPLFSGSILTRGLSAEHDPETGLVSWTVEGYEA